MTLFKIENTIVIVPVLKVFEKIFDIVLMKIMYRSLTLKYLTGYVDGSLNIQ